MKSRTKRQSLGKTILILALLTGLFFVVPIRFVHAVSISVVNTNDNGAGSLRQAIADATAGDTITFDSSLAGQTITLESDLLIEKDLTIDGSGLSPQVTVSGGNVAHWVIHSSTVSIKALSIANGYTAGNGGAILANGNLTLIDSTIRNSFAEGSGGGIYSSSNLTIQNTAIYQNQGVAGGGIRYQGDGSVSIINTTITGNQAGRGGGVYISGIPSFIMTNVTIADNPTGDYNFGFFSNALGVQLINTVIATEDGVSYRVPLDRFNSILCDWCSSADVGLMSLADNGGPTQTMALLPGSSLIDAGSDSSCPSIDQRGVTRPGDAHCDIGAYEYWPDNYVTNTNDSGTGSLRQALVNSFAGDTIRFDPSLAGQTIYLASELEVDKSLTINGMDLIPHVTISGDTENDGTGDVQLMTITPLSTVSIYGIDFANGKNSPGTNSGGINNLGSLAIHSGLFSDNVGDQGGAIRNSGILTVEDTIFNNNSAFEGGAILNNPNALVEIRNGAFNWNSADIGEGGAGAIANLGTLVIYDSSFIENTAYNGGAIVNTFGGTTTISNSIFMGNSASEYGGAVYNFEGTTTITQSTFSANSASSGGAIGIGRFGEPNPATTNISESLIINNEASYVAGGVLFESGTSTSLDKVTVSGNTAPSAGGILNASYQPLLITNSAIYNNIATLPSDPGGILSLSSPLTIRNSTITGNSGTGVGAQGDTVISNSTIAGNLGNGLDFFDFTLSITNTILANNGGLDCQNLYGTVLINQNNLIETNSDCGNALLTSDPNLGLLANNNGLTKTMALLPVSPAINAGDDATCEETDQRGVARPVGPHCDIGAYEVEWLPPTDISFSANSVVENQPVGTSIGTFLTTDPDVGDIHTYSFCGGTDDTSFQFNESDLLTNAVFDFETKSVYSVCIRTTDSYGLSYDKSFVINVLDVPGMELLSPSSASVVHTVRPAFDWSNFPDARGYQIQVSKSAGFGTTLINVTVNGATNSQYMPTKDLPANTLLHWRVRAKLSATKYSAWSSIFTFTTPNPPGAPVLVSPANGALLTNLSPTLDWSDSTIPAGTMFSHYQVQLDDNADFSSTIVNTNVGVSTLVVGPLNTNTQYYWHIRAWNTNGDYSAWSAVRSFREAILAPTLLSPIGGMTVGSLKPLFDWGDAIGATGYTIQVSLSNTFNMFAINVTLKTPTSQYVHTYNLQAGKLYYWRVRANGPNGPSLWSTTESFNTP